MKDIKTFTNESTVGLTSAWDFTWNPYNDSNDNNYWGINSAENTGYPFLSWQGYTAHYPATITTEPVDSIETTSAIGNGTITNLGVSNPTQHGVCWSTSENPTMADSKTEEGATSSTEAFTSDITGLTPGQTYYVRAYATNDAATAYGTEKTLTTLKANQTITFNAMDHKTYGDANFNLAATASSGLDVSYSSSNTTVATIDGSTVTIVGVGSTTITASQNGNTNYNAAEDVEKTLTVSKKELTVTGANADNKVYDGTTDATITGATLSGVISGDTVSLENTTSGTFTQATVGDNITVTTEMTLTGDDASNYSLTQPNLTANITKATPTLSEISATGIVYSQPLSDATISGTQTNPNDDTTVNGTYAFDNPDTQPAVADSDTTDYAYTFTPEDTDNYTTATGTVTITVNETEQTITGLSNIDKAWGDEDFALNGTSSSELAVS